MGRKTQVTLPYSKIVKMENEISEQVFRKAVQLFMLALHDEFGFGEERLIRLMMRTDLYAEHIDEKRVSMEEMNAIWEKASGLRYELLKEGGGNK